MAKRRKLARGGSHPAKQGSSLKKAPQQKTKPGGANKATKEHRQTSQSEPIIPFSAEDRILLVGEGDLSFAASLVTSHYCASVTATVLEKSPAELIEKYPQAAENIAAIESEDGCGVVYSIDATSMRPFQTSAGDGGSKKSPSNSKSNPHDRVGAMDRIIFNFPHVGGKSTDVNRQVRYNQELLVAFFSRALLSLAPGGSIIVTLFEGEPYTLWNVRDLARHSGLRVDRSFRFAASAYPGYHHARTLGVVRSRHNGDEPAPSAWKGEDRPARSYVFVRKDEDLGSGGPPQQQQKQQKQQTGKGGSKKRARTQDGDSDNSDDG